MPLGDRELVTPPPTLAGLQELSGPALIAMLLASAIAVLDGLASNQLVIVGLLAIPPVIAAMSSSLPETAVVAAFCVILALLSIIWSQGIDGGQRLVALTTVAAGALAGLWVAALRLKLSREQAASELLADAGALMEDALDQRQRAQHLAELAIDGLGDVAMVDIVMPDGSIQRMAARGRDTDVADIFLKLRASAPIDPHGPHPVAEVIRSGRIAYLTSSPTRRSIESPPARTSERRSKRIASSRASCSRSARAAPFSAR